MKHYTATIPLELAEKLKEKGMPIEKEGENTWCPPYAACFDWLMEKNIRVYVIKALQSNQWRGMVNTNGMMYYRTWRKAANAAIERALTLI